MKRLMSLLIAAGVLASVLAGCAKKPPEAFVNVFKGENVVCSVSIKDEPYKSAEFTRVINNTIDEKMPGEAEPDYSLEFSPVDAEGSVAHFALWIVGDKIYISEDDNPDNTYLSQISAEEFEKLISDASVN